MRRAFIWPVILFLFLSVFSACEVRSGAETPSPAPTTGKQTGHWELLCGDYSPVSYDLCDAISFPKFDGKTKEEWEHDSISIGKIDQTFITWAADGRLSPDGRHLVYASNKDCLEVQNAMSVVLLDLYSGEERVLLSGRDGSYDSVIGWLDDETLLCLSATPYGDQEGVAIEHLICDLEGNAISVPPEEFSGPVPFAMQGRLLAWVTGPESKSLRLVRVEEDGSISRLAQQEFDGYPINGGGISPDGKWLAFPLRAHWGEDPSRTVCLWGTEDGSVTRLENPAPREGTDPAAIWVHWDGAHPAVDFTISDAPDSNGHNELWRYTLP